MAEIVQHSASSVSLWIVEDDTLFLDELEAMIAETGDLICSRAFGDIEELEAFIFSESDICLPDIVLMDIQLPGKSGIEGVRLLRAKFPELMIVMLTLHDDEARIFEALRVGASGYLLKGLPYQETLSAIRETHRGWVSMPGAVAQKVLGRFNPQANRDAYNLTGREYDVLEKMCEGLGNQGIGEALFISENTVNQHVKSIFSKLNVNTRAAAVAKALRERMVG